IDMLVDTVFNFSPVSLRGIIHAYQAYPCLSMLYPGHNGQLALILRMSKFAPVSILVPLGAEGKVMAAKTLKISIFLSIRCFLVIKCDGSSGKSRQHLCNFSPLLFCFSNQFYWAFWIWFDGFRYHDRRRIFRLIKVVERLSVI
ncbi:hypothetical protein PMAYCL1PPCAC_05899, partial [Pristionchus mayeri]